MQVTHTPLFSAQLPDDWEYYPDEHGGGAVPPSRQAVIHFHAEAVTDPKDLPNLSRMLAGFLTQHHRPVATDELMRIKLPGALCFAWQYVDVSAHRAVRVWIVGNEAAWAFINFQCPLDEEPSLRPLVDQIVKDFRLTP